jgi:hypothetical protein
MDEILPGGVANAGRVTRHGAFVLRPSNPHSPSIHSFLRAIRSAGFEGASLPVEICDDGRERLVYIEGDVPTPPFPSWAQSDEALVSITSLMLGFHRASALVDHRMSSWSGELSDPVGGPIVCHNDVCLENVVFREGKAVALLDFDFAAPGRAVYDLAQLARMCIPIDDDLSAQRLGWNVSDRPTRLRMVAEAYGLDEGGGGELLRHLDHSMQTGGLFVQRRVAAGDPNFILMLEQMGGMERYERRRRWWEGNRGDFVAALS